jgi:hypothetical protein
VCFRIIGPLVRVTPSRFLSRNKTITGHNW